MFTGYGEYQDFGFSIKDIGKKVRGFAKAVGQPIKVSLKDPKKALSFKKQFRMGKDIGKAAEAVVVSTNPADRYLQKFNIAGKKAGGIGKILGRVGEKARKNPIATTAIVYGAATAIGKGLTTLGKGTVVKGAGGLVSAGSSATGAGSAIGAGTTAVGAGGVGEVAAGGASLLQKAKDYIEKTKEITGMVKGVTGKSEEGITEDSPGFIQAGMFGNISPITIGLFLTASAIAYFAFAPKISR